MSIQLPENLPEIETLLYKTDECSIILNSKEYNKKNSITLLMRISPHDKYSNIVPEEDVDCKLENKNIDEVSSVSDLPKELSSKFMELIDMLESKYGLKTNDKNNIGFCVYCSCGKSSFNKDLNFVTYLE